MVKANRDDSSKFEKGTSFYLTNIASERLITDAPEVEVGNFGKPPRSHPRCESHGHRFSDVLTDPSSS